MTFFKIVFSLLAVTFTSLLCAEPKLSLEKPAVLVVGGGISGLACASSCLSLGFSTIVCDAPPEEIFDQTISITSEPLLLPISWQKAVQKMREQFIKNGGKAFKTSVQRVTKQGDVFFVETENGSFYASAVVVATGSQPPQYDFFTPSVQKERVLLRLWEPKMFVPADTVIFIGNDENAVKNAIKTSFRVKKVFLFAGILQANPLAGVIKRIHNITWVNNAVIKRLIPAGNRVQVVYSSSGSSLIAEGSWVVLENSWYPKSEVVLKAADIDSQGALITNEETKMTSLHGLFGCGEVTRRVPFTFARALSDGLETADAVSLYLLEKGVMPEKKPIQPEEPVQPKPQVPIVAPQDGKGTITIPSL